MNNNLESDVGLFKGWKKGWMETYTGKKVNPLKLKMEDICLVDIAHALSLICRYNGHCRTLYSVADHSIRVAWMLEGSGWELAALMHDSAEAYFGDVIRPLKHIFPDVVEAEHKALDVIFKKYNINLNLRGAQSIKDMDNIVGATEARDLMASGGAEWGNLPKPLPGVLIPYYDPPWVEAKFKKLFKEYGGRE